MTPEVNLSRSFVGSNVISVRFAIGDRVTIVDAGCVGRVKAINISAGLREYQVSYFDEDKVRRIEWLGEEDLVKSIRS